VGGQFGQARFAAGILAELDTDTGVLSWVNRAHPPPLLVRQGRWLRSLDCEPTPPMGLGLGIAPALCHDQLEPGGRLLLYTDGVTEARSRPVVRAGTVRRFIIRSEADGLTAPETLRRLIQAILNYRQPEGLRRTAPQTSARRRAGGGCRRR
jgi:serine phosphatase RsbU (regulator of sigma subunit)